MSDDILQEAGWKTQEAKNKTIDKVLVKHNYLRSAYLILEQLELQEKYYPFIKDMATRPRNISWEGYELGFDDIEYALYGLAKFRKKEDVQIIKRQLMDNVWRLGDVSFRLMKEYPDTAYLNILQTYHRRRFYKFLGNDRYGFTGSDENRAGSKDFIGALVSQQNDKSAKLLDTILRRLPSITCAPNKESIEDEVVMQIWEHPNPVYAQLKQRIKGKAEQILKSQITLPPLKRHLEPIDTTKENIRWYP